QYAMKNWPWMKGMLLSNLDASTSPYHQGPEDGLPWFAILNADHSPRPAWSAFRAMTAQQAARSPAAAAAAPSAAAATGAADDAAAQAAQEAQASGGVIVRVTGTGGTGVTLRDAPSTTGRRLGVVPEGSRLTVIGDDVQASGHTWRNVKTANGQTGWVAGEFVQAE